MDYQFIANLLENNPAIKVLRARNGALILSFLFKEFKENNITIVPGENLIISLATTLEDMDTGEADTDYLDKSRFLLDDWCKENNRYLRKYTSDKGQTVYELTSYMEKVFRWLESLKPRDFVGTESRFNDILRRLEELVSRTTEDPKEKIRELKSKIKEIDREIQEIKSSGEVRVFSSWQIKERFDDISRSSRDLLADFKEVEQNFKSILDKIYEEEAVNTHTRGEILGFTLDAHQELMNSPQGKTFNSFWNFLIADSGEDMISRLVERVYEMMLEKGLSYDDNFLKKLKFYLHRAGKRIITSNHALAGKINRVLSENSLLHRQRIKELIGEIKKQVFKVKEAPPEENFLMFISGDLNINMDVERPLSFPEQKRVLKSVEEADNSLPLPLDAPLFNQFFVDRKRLEWAIREMLKLKPEVTLQEILARFPVEQGLSEVVTYFEIAASTSKAKIIEDSIVDLEYEYKERHIRVKAPEVIFIR